MTKRIDNPWHPYPDAPSLAAVLKEARATLNGEMLSAVFGGGIDAVPAAGLFRNMMRLHIRACEEYETAVAEVVTAIEERNTSPLITAATHWEGCIEATHRCIGIAELFRRQLGKWAPEDNLLRIDKSARFTEEELAPIRDLRDAAQHLDEELQNYSPDPQTADSGAGFFIYSDASGIRFHGTFLAYAALADALSRIGALCKWLEMQNPGPGHPLALPSRTSSVKREGSEAYRKPFMGKVG